MLLMYWLCSCCPVKFTPYVNCCFSPRAFYLDQSNMPPSSAPKAALIDKVRKTLHNLRLHPWHHRKLKIRLDLNAAMWKCLHMWHFGTSGVNWGGKWGKEEDQWKPVYFCKWNWLHCFKYCKCIHYSSNQTGHYLLLLLSLLLSVATARKLPTVVGNYF